MFKIFICMSHFPEIMPTTIQHKTNTHVVQCSYFMYRRIGTSYHVTLTPAQLSTKLNYHKGTITIILFTVLLPKTVHVWIHIFE